MTLTCTHLDDGCELVPEGAMTIMEAAELRDQLALALVTAHGRVRVDLSRITELDSCGLQLLLALVREGTQVQLHSPSAAARDRIVRFGLAATLRLEGASHGA
ncbi:lipid asymmetry maintenance protein MlaB [Vogesella amnigena]|uniref:Lipid asymmetry maintenance protein MlaB n=1 Tax=Vogesella amnigena TaxID=1507449 RepID=A0ABV7TR33_9NEIS